MDDLDDLGYRQRVAHLLGTISWLRAREARRALERASALLTDRRWWPTVLTPPPAPSPLLAEGQERGGGAAEGGGGGVRPSRETFTVADVGPLAVAVREVLSRLPPHRLGPAGAVNLLLAVPDDEALAHEISRLSPLMDDAFFAALLDLNVEADWLGLEAFARQVEALRQLLLSLRTRELLGELAAQVVRACSDREAAALVVQWARTAPEWLQSGLEEVIPAARRGEVKLPHLAVALALQKALAARAEGQAEATTVASLEKWRPLQAFVRHYRLAQKAPFRPGEDWLARHGARARAFLLQLSQVQGAQTAALFRLALAGSQAEEEQAIADEPRMLSAEGEEQARHLAADAARQGQHTLAARLTAAAERIAARLADLARPEHNPVVRLAAQVQGGDLSLDEALARLEEPETLQGLSVAHLAALDEQATHLYRRGHLREAEVLATLNHAAARRVGHLKMRADTAISLAGIRSELGQQAEAVALFEEAARLAEQIDDPKRLILAVGPLGTAYLDLGDYENARRCYERALELARTAGEEGLEVAALGNLADLSLQTGDLPAALSLSGQALALARALGEPYQVAQALGTRAAVLHRSGRLEEAVAYYREALETLRAIPDPGSEARQRLHLGQALAERGEFEAALAELERVRQWARATANAPLQAGALSAIGALHLRRGDLSRALQALEAALTLEGGLRPPERAICLLHIAGVQMSLGQLEFAGQALAQAEALAAEAPDPRLKAAVAFSRARYQGERGQWSEGEADARQALASARHLQDVDLELAALDLLGQACEAQERPEKAEDWYAQELDRAREVRHPAEEAGALLHLGIVQARRNRAADARASLTAALEAATALGLTHLRYYAHYHLGLLCTSSPDDLPEALDHYRAAIALLEQERAALRQVEAFERRYMAGRQNVYRLAAGAAFRLGRPLEALEMLEQGRARGLVRRLLLREALPPAVPEELRERYARAFQTVQALRNLVYGEPGWSAQLMEDARLGLAALDKAGSEEEFEALMAQARAQEQAGRRQALREAEAELEEVARRVRAWAPDFDLQPDLSPLDWDAITPEPTTAVVALFVGDETGRAVVLHPSGLRTVDLPGLRRAEVERLLYGLPEPLARAREEARPHLNREPRQVGFTALVMHYLTLRWMIEQSPSPLGWQVALHTLISEKRGADDLRRIRRRLELPPPEKTLFDLEDEQRLSLWRHLLEEMAGALRARLWEPLLPLLREPGVTQVVLVPDADLHALPLALGLADEADAPAVALAPTLRLYAQSRHWLREREPREDTLMLIAGPTGDLPAAEMEAGLLRDLFAAHDRATFVLSGDQATLASLIRTARVGNYWHFVGHARYEGGNPSLSALHLAGGEHLPLFLVPIWLDLRATRLAVLSACETAMAPARDPAQELEGLFTAFLAAGAPAVLASLWPVEELSTALLVHRFYQYHLGDPREGLAPRPPAQALRDAQRWLRALPAADAQHLLVDAARRRNLPRGSPAWAQLLALESGVEYPYTNPYFWAGFVLVGI